MKTVLILLCCFSLIACTTPKPIDPPEEPRESIPAHVGPPVRPGLFDRVPPPPETQTVPPSVPESRDDSDWTGGPLRFNRTGLKVIAGMLVLLAISELTIRRQPPPTGGSHDGGPFLPPCAFVSDPFPGLNCQG